ncbi:MAG TPA: LytR C-terminal domain-containing protein [Candidatus Woesebacteria bacterium]|nr:LytR C-terminal domain-containing protein [Candidatus Woesebacteria bacterium]HPR99216.1 LytR C-terminal domain-containing protein [Candidatus Woesebacteria bacterium]
MSLFSKPKVVLWPKKDSLEIYFDKTDNNTLSFEIDLWQSQSADNLQNLATFFQKNNVSQVYVILDDTYIITKTFIYDSVITTLDPNEVVTLAKDSVDFKISPEAVTFDLEPDNERTLVRTRIFNQEKFLLLTSNLEKLGLKVLDYETLSSALVKLYAHFDSGQHFLFYPINTHDYLAILSNQGRVYLTSIIKKSLPELKKLLNYSQAFFANPKPTQYFPGDNYNESEIAARFQKASNLPLPVLSFFVGNSKPKTDIIKPTVSVIDSIKIEAPMENNKKNILPIIAVFLITILITSAIVWFILDQNNKNTEINTPAGENEPMTEEISSPVITEAPTPTLAEISKTIKIQVLNATEINGQAATIKAELTTLGFTSVSTGNSAKKETTNQIQAKKEIATDYFLQKIPQFSDSTVSELAVTSSYDLIFIIGTDLKATSTPSASPSINP